jgi:predicted HAD superfamily hydrolase
MSSLLFVRKWKRMPGKMSLKKFYHLKSLIRYADRIVKDYDTVSFDQFDTLFIRRIHEPDMVKPAVARFIAQRASMFGYEWTWDGVQSLRDTYENEQRAQTAKKFEDHEACYPDYMRKVLAQIFKDNMTDDLLAEVTDYELNIEKAMLVPRADLVAWIKKIHAQGKKILIISDIYLPSSHLKRLVDHFGLMSFVTNVVSSADTFLAKASGKAFPMLAEKFSINVERWLHVGDNPISDGLRPSEFGIRALVLKDISEIRRKTITRTYTIFSNRRIYWKGRLLQQLMLPLEEENSPRSPLYVEGYNFLAPLVGAFVQKIVEKTQKLGIPRIYFMSREGWTFKKFWERAAPFLSPDGLLPEIRYLYVSRMALAGASCAHQGLSQTKVSTVFQAPGNRDMKDLCRVFGLDIIHLIPFMRRYGLREDDILSPLYSGWDSKAHYKLMYLIEDQDFQVEVKRQTMPHNEALQRYLEQEHFFDVPDVALVDIGWTGTIQRFLYDAIKHRDDKPRFHGFLFTASRGVPYPTTPDNYIEGLIYDRDRFDFASSVIMYIRDFFEEAFRAPHPGLDTYKLIDNGYKLIFRDKHDADGQAELVQNKYFTPLQQGILDAASRFGAASAVLGFPVEQLKPWLRYLLVSKLAFPKAKEVKLFRHKYHMDDFHGKHTPPQRFIKSQKHLWDYSILALRWIPWLRMKYYIYKNRSV